MTAQHTPGPWETLTFSNHELQTDFAMVKIGSRVHMVGYSDEDKANARLIAVAPELLAALRRIAETGANQSGNGSPWVHWVDQARVAITKATGEKS